MYFTKKGITEIRPVLEILALEVHSDMRVLSRQNEMLTGRNNDLLHRITSKWHVLIELEPGAEHGRAPLAKPLWMWIGKFTF